MNPVEGPHRFFAPWHGKVVDRNDPEGLYRVRVNVPGLVEPSAWAFPMGTLGGGSPQRGGWIVPALDADVVLMFLGGDPEHPVYLPAWWGKRPNGGSEMPANAKDLTPAEVPQVQCLQVGTLVFTVDEREGKRLFSIEDQATGDALVWDLEKQGMSITMTSALLINVLGMVSIEGTLVKINDRVVLATDAPI